MGILRLDARREIDGGPQAPGDGQTHRPEVDARLSHAVAILKEIERAAREFGGHAEHYRASVADGLADRRDRLELLTEPHVRLAADAPPPRPAPPARPPRPGRYPRAPGRPRTSRPRARRG